MCLLFAGGQIFAKNFYLRTNQDAVSWQSVTDGTVITLTPGDTLFSTIGRDSTVFLAPGTYHVLTLNIKDNGKIYGGFSGQETTVNPDNRELIDLDENGIVEPWEFKNEAVITTQNPDFRFNQEGISTGGRLLIVSGSDAEANGITFKDFHYNLFAGPISLGVAAQNPATANNTMDKKGILRFCTVKKIKASNPNSPFFSGIVMSTNKFSLIDGCLIEENVMESANTGGAVFFNRLGGKVSNSVVRNNLAPTGRGAAVFATSNSGADTDAIIENCVIYNNYAGKNGGSVRGESQAGKAGIQIMNSTIVNNETGGTGSSIELINNGLVANSVVVGLATNDLRLNVGNYIVSSAYGTYNIPTPNSENTGVAEITVDDAKFISPTDFIGPMIPDYTFPFDNLKYSKIRKANFKISASESIAVQTEGAKYIPSSYMFSNISIPITVSIPTIDLLGNDRPLYEEQNLSLGAYQFSGTSSNFDKLILDENKNIQVLNNSIVVKNMKSRLVKIFGVDGKLIYSKLADSDRINISCNKGVYIVIAGNVKTKLLIR